MRLQWRFEVGWVDHLLRRQRHGGQSETSDELFDHDVEFLVLVIHWSVYQIRACSPGSGVFHAGPRFCRWERIAFLQELD